MHIVRTVFVLVVFAGLVGCGGVSLTPNSSGSGVVPVRYGATVKDKARVRVVRGDTVWAIAQRHGLDMRAVIAANGLRPPFLLQPGQWLDLPKARRHKVVRGDTLYGVARRYGVAPGALARANRLGPPYTIHVGQLLRLPGQGAAPPMRQAQAPAAVERDRKKLGSTVTPKIKPMPKVAVAAAPKKPPKRVVTAPPPVRSGRFSWPLRGKVVSEFGAKTKGLHNDGINISAPRGAPVLAAENGVVVYAGNELRGFGNLLLLKHSGGWVTAYAHNERLTVGRGAKVKKGQPIAHVGSSGGVTTPQLHFEIRRGKRAIDPMKYLGRQSAGVWLSTHNGPS